MILTKRFSCTFVLLLIALTLCCFTSSAYAAKITTKSTTAAATPTKAITHATDTELAPASAEANASPEDDDEDDADTEEEEDDDSTAEKTAVQAADDTTSSLSVWGLVRGVWNWLKDDLSESLLGDDSTKSTAVEGRTFGKIRRLQMALIPIIFKFGILSAMVFFLVLLGLKTFFLLKLLVFMNAAVILGKFLTLKSNLGGHVEHSAPSWGGGYSNWSPHTSSGGWAASAPAAVAAPPPPSKEIHLHIHGAQAQLQGPAYSSYGSGSQVVQQHGGWERRNDPYSAYEPAPTSVDSEIETDLSSSVGPIGMLPTQYPANHRRVY